ncbi:hypothetical protein D9M72_585900 [compost metagenome]
MVDRVEQREQFDGLVGLAEPGKCEDCPHCCMAVLPAVLAQAGRVALDVAGVKGALVEGRRKQQRKPVLTAHQILVQ